MTNANSKFQQQFRKYWSKYSTIAILLLLIAIFGAMQPRSFLQLSNMIKMLEQSVIYVLMAMGVFHAILLGGIDLSISSTTALSGVVMAKLMLAGLHPLLAILAGCILLGTLVGAMNGTLINSTGLPPFIITLGTQRILRGIAIVAADSRAVVGFPVAFTKNVGGKVFGWLPVPVVITIFVALILTFFTQKTLAGRNLYAIGGNPKSAMFAGIRVKWHTVLAFTISGICGGLAGMVNTARLGAAEPNAANAYETFAIAGAVIGGTSFFGGEGVIPKVCIGGIVIGCINNGLNMIGVSSYYQQIAMGALIVAAVTLDRFFGRSHD